MFSRHVVGWMLAPEDSAELARPLIDETCQRQGVTAGQLTLHTDLGSSVTSKSVAMLLADLGVTKTHSRPYVSDEHLCSEAQFKTLKYRSDFPDRFGSVVDGRAFLGPFFGWYSNDHHHSELGLHTPADVHHELAEARAAYSRSGRRVQGGDRALRPGSPLPA